MNEIEREIRQGEISLDARYAREVLSNPAFVSAFKKIESDIVDSLKSVGVGDTESQRSIVIALQVLSRIEKHMKSLINAENVAEFNARRKKVFGVF